MIKEKSIIKSVILKSLMSDVTIPGFVPVRKKLRCQRIRTAPQDNRAKCEGIEDLCT